VSPRHQPTGSPLSANAAERKRWNDPYWTRIWPAREALTGLVTDVLLGHLSPRSGERLLDIGSGGGLASIAAARLVGTAGTVVGVDISQPLTAFARQRAENQGLRNVSFAVADAQSDTFDGAPFDAAMSQFGVMFFEDPRVAFANVLRQVRAGGRLTFACWQSADRNPWNVPHAISQFLPRAPVPPAGGTGPGAFSLGDPDRTRDLLLAAGWVNIDCSPYAQTVTVTRDAIVDDAQPAFMGVSDEDLPAAQAALEHHLARFVTVDGSLEVPIAYQIITAAKPD
jgi:SAM-dependent methyltransferase